MFVRVGNVTSIGTTETYIRFKNLPALKSGDMVTSSQLYLNKQYALYYDEENYAWFDSLQLYKEEFGQSYQYDSKGNVV